MSFATLLGRLIRVGNLTVIAADGKRHVFAGAALAGVAPVTIRIHDPALDRRLALRPTLAVGEAYMDGTLTVEDGSLTDFLALACANVQQAAPGPGDRLARLLRRFHQHNPVFRARRNAGHHYDRDEAFYALFLDADRQYSCAYFAAPDMTLDEAQAAKKRHIAAKLLLAPGQRVLDIGCGWGGLALTLAASEAVSVTGITLSREQLATARRRAAENGLAERVQFELADYRRIGGRFDRIVSVGMFEHVGCRHYPRFFAALRERLDEDGVALLHAIGRSDGPGTTNPWLRKYIFPGGYAPALSEVLAAVEPSGLHVTDIEILRGHYARTLRAWSGRFAANRDRAVALVGERVCRMWEFYLAGAEAAFTHQGQMVFQMQLARRADAVPMTRDYLATCAPSPPSSPR
ncbi:MAG: class I SAM-dependent methyltransferase [Magnetospirillum sp.]|nr:class I SAM-dependent methyltransferase [Magnetospirillum sp.]